MATASTIDETDRCLALQNRQLRLRDEVLLKVGSRWSGIFFDMGFWNRNHISISTRIPRLSPCAVAARAKACTWELGVVRWSCIPICFLFWLSLTPLPCEICIKGSKESAKSFAGGLTLRDNDRSSDVRVAPSLLSSSSGRPSTSGLWIASEIALQVRPRI